MKFRHIILITLLLCAVSVVAQAAPHDVVLNPKGGRLGSGCHQVAHQAHQAGMDRVAELAVRREGFVRLLEYRTRKVAFIL